jgi:subtilisin family serine protease
MSASKVTFFYEAMRQKGAKVINLSLGGTADSATLRAAIASAAQTAVVVAGAGNSNSSAPFYPAA